ncbi:MAG: BamA/TamA family outer membrane protein [Opitutaceae bacterium]|nr:BamA/TamA family outer membrane protein [Opitutaceae bacterium]
MDGTGWLRDRELRTSLERLLGEERGEVLQANAVEDAMFLLMSAVQAEGFLKPVITVECVEASGKKTELTLDATMTTTVPRTMAAREVRFRVERGLRFFVRDVKFEGLHALKESAARSFFAGDSALFSGKAGRAYTPARLSRALDGLQAELRQLGHAEAEVRASDVAVDERTGEVQVVVAVTEGARWHVAAVRVEGADGTDVTVEGLEKYSGRLWTEALQQTLAGEVRIAFYAQGYADARVHTTRAAGPAREGKKEAAVTLRVEPGERVRIGEVRFEGAEHMHDGVMRRRVQAQPDAPLNPLEIDQARFRLARLGVFEKVALRYEPPHGPVRSPVFTVREGRTLETNLLFGYGSYEQARGAVELRQFNLFERAHQSRLLLAQSMKSSRGDYSYTVPEIFGESIDGTARVFGLQREELSFLRQEYGANVAVSLPVRWLGAHGTAGYTFQSLRNRDNELATRAADDTQVTVASLDAGLTRDRRDNPLRPRRGYRWFAQMEAASRGLGGGAEFQRFEGGGAYHTPWGAGRWVHAAFTHGLITTWGTSDRLLPVNKRFFPGGGSSIRGYRDGEASPRGADGRFVGAKSYALANLDLEQALFGKWTAVIFVDALATAAQLRNYPLAGERLYTAGLGVRYQTLIGPIRVEYGRNLNPRAGDPGGTWQISVGAPF